MWKGTQNKIIKKLSFKIYYMDRRFNINIILSRF